MAADNLSYFGVLKNIEIKTKDESVKKKISEKINLSIPKSIAFNRNSFGDIHFSLLENIIFPKGSISKANKVIAKWIGELPEEIPLSPMTQKIESYDSANHCMQTIDVWNDEEKLNDSVVVNKKKDNRQLDVGVNKKKREKIKLISRKDKPSKRIDVRNTKDEDEDSDYVDSNFKQGNATTSFEQRMLKRKERELLRSMETHQQSVAIDKKEMKDQEQKNKRVNAGASIRKIVSRIFNDFVDNYHMIVSFLT